jgi:hypothetical protein
MRNPKPSIGVARSLSTHAQSMKFTDRVRVDHLENVFSRPDAPIKIHPPSRAD